MRERPHIVIVDGKEHPIEEVILGDLLLAGQLYVFESDEATMALHVNCSDMFAWACADSEPIPEEELVALWKSYDADHKWGTTKWCAVRRQQKPQPPVEKAMNADGSWDDVMEALPPNRLDRELWGKPQVTTEG